MRGPSPTRTITAVNSWGALYQLPNEVGTLEAVRGTVVATDLTLLREDGLFERYATHVSSAKLAELTEVTAGEWVNLDLMMPHFLALDEVHSGNAEAFDFGMRVATRLHGSLLRTLVRLAGKVGATPWAALSQAYKLWQRSWRGGGIVAYRVGDTRAELKVVGAPPAQIRYWRNAMAGATRAGIDGLCRDAHVRVDPARTTEDSFTMVVSWS